jgi:hypothetical protein
VEVMQAVLEYKDITAEQLNSDVVPHNQPVIFRGLNTNWPIVKAYEKSPRCFVDYLKQFDHGQLVSAMIGGPNIHGRFFYTDDIKGFNYERKKERFGTLLQALLELENIPSPPAIAIQGLDLNEHLSEFTDYHKLSILEQTVEPRLWLGNKTVTTTHYDTMENIACAVAGQRRFVLFPPEQVANLYIGPLLLTPAGTPMSMVDVRNPDFEKYPNFSQALSVAQEVVMQPGDALYIPSFWWHNVESQNSISGLVNYWWTNYATKTVTPYQSMLHSLLSIPSLPLKQRLVWQKLFEHYVFQASGHPAAHLPSDLEDIITVLPLERKKHLMKLLAEALLK